MDIHRTHSCCVLQWTDERPRLVSLWQRALLARMGTLLHASGIPSQPASCSRHEWARFSGGSCGSPARPPPWEEACTCDITPYEPGLLRRSSSFRQGGHPSDRRTREATREDLRISGEQLAVPASRPHNPAGGDPVWPFPANRDRDHLGIRDLPGCRSCAGPNVPDDVPALDQLEHAMRLVPKPDVRRSRSRSGWTLERCTNPRTAREPEHELLDPEVSCVSRLLEWIPAHVDDQRAIEGCEGALPNVHRQRSAETPLHQADRGLRNSDRAPELCLRHAPPFP